MARDGTLRVRVVGDTANFSKSMKGITGKVGKFAKKLAKVGAVVGGAALAGGAAVLKLGAELEDMDKKAAVVFEDQLPSVKKWAKANAGAMGLTSTELTGLTANFADLLKPMGFTAEQATDMAKDTNELSGALAKWSGGQKDAAEVSEILAKAMLGERDGLKSLGISITEADVKRRLAANGAAELEGAALEQAKAIATQQLIMEKSTDAQDAWADGQDDLSVKINKVSSFVKELRDKAVRTLLPHVIRIAEAMMAWGEQVAKDLQPVLEDLSGWWDDNGPAIIKAAKDIARAVGKTLKKAFDKVVDVFKFVNRNAEVMIPLLGGILAGFVAFKTVVAVTKAWAKAQKALNVVMAMNPIGLVVIAVAGLVAAIVVAYKRSETFRRIVNGAFDAVKRGAFALAAAAVGAFRRLLNFWLTTAEKIVGGAAKAFGWVPGLGDKLKGAHRAIKGFRETVNRELGKVERNLTVRARTRGVSRTLANLRSIRRAVVQTQTSGITVRTSGGRGRVTQFHTGGIVKKGGLAEVAEKERVLTADERKDIEGRNGSTNITVHVNAGTIVSDERELARIVLRALREAGRSGLDVSALTA